MTSDLGISPFLILLAFVIFWIMICHLLARLGGWTKFAEAYPAESDFAGAKKFMQSASFEIHRFLPSNYSRALTVGADQRGAYFAVFFTFRPGHEPFFIPYSDLSGEESRFLFFRQVKLHGSRTPDVTIAIGQELARWIEEQSGGLWAYKRLPQTPA